MLHKRDLLQLLRMGKLRKIRSRITSTNHGLFRYPSINQLRNLRPQMNSIQERIKAVSFWHLRDSEVLRQTGIKEISLITQDSLTDLVPLVLRSSLIFKISKAWRRDHPLKVLSCTKLSITQEAEGETMRSLASRHYLRSKRVFNLRPFL